ANQCDDDAFLDQLFAQRGDGTFDQIAAIVGWHDAHPGRQRRLDLFDFLFNAIDDVECVLAVAHDDNAADRFAASIELSHPAPDVAPEMDISDVLHVDRRTVLDFEDDVLNVLNFFDVTAAANVILGRCDLESLAADIGVAHLDRANDLAERNVVSNERVWIEIDLVLLNEPAHRRDFCNAFN